MKLVTWNIWFDPYENESRWEALISEALAQSPDVIGLQEVTAPVMARIRADGRLAGWWCSDPYLDAWSSYDVLLLTLRRPSGFERLHLRSRMGRSLVYTQLEGLTVGTVHLESLRPNGRWRAEQLSAISEAMAGEEDVLFMGDMNYSDGAPEATTLGSAWRDLWRELYPERDGFTVDTERNIMRQQSKDGRVHQGRYDRAFLKSKRWAVHDVRLLGVEPLPGDPLTLPSDHFGLCIELAQRG